MSADERRDSKGSGGDSSSEPGKNEVSCLVKLLDGEILHFAVERKAKAEELIDHAMSRLNVVERDYFGIYYAVREQRMFLDPTKTCAHQYPDSKESQWVLHFGVKYYVPDPSQLKDDFTKHLYCLQLLQDIQERRILLDPTSLLALQLAALRLQGSLGAYNAEQHGKGYTHEYLDFLYANENDIPLDADNRLREMHQEKSELTPAESDMEFLNIAKDLPRYGKHLFQATELLDEERSVEIGVGWTGISIYYESKLVTDFTWSTISKLFYHGHRFKIHYHPDEDLEHWEIKKHKFDATESQWAKRIWKECIEQHTFFRLTVPGVRPQSSCVPTFNRRITVHFSGRTLAQIQKRDKRRGKDDVEEQEDSKESEKHTETAEASRPTAQDPEPQITDSRPDEEDSPKASGSNGDASSQEEGKLRVELMRDKFGFGFSLCGGAECNSPLYVIDIIRGGAAEKDGRLRESDEILEINGRSTECMIHSVAITAIKTGGQSVKLVVRREAKDGDEGENLPTNTDGNDSAGKK